ncbi:MAG: GNAT family N-acetyltransferase [Actinobacteria bacterium]|nr:GNAT family N-acetyltransferase [Actinomycetota bacterium]
MMAASSKRWCKVLELAGEILMNEKNASHATIIADPQFMRPLGLADEAAVAELFEACFSSKTDSQWYAWKYLSNKTYDGLAIGMWHEAGLIGHYAGFPRELVCGSTRFAALQIGDVMIHPKARHGLAKRNRFARLTRCFFSEHIRPARLLRIAQLPGAEVTLEFQKAPKADQFHDGMIWPPEAKGRRARFDIAYGFPNARHLGSRCDVRIVLVFRSF